MPTGETTAVAPRICECGNALKGKQARWCSRLCRNAGWDRSPRGRASRVTRNARYAGTLNGTLVRLHHETERRSHR